jgi:hypothetical protein
MTGREGDEPEEGHTIKIFPGLGDELTGEEQEKGPVHRKA